MNAYLYLAGAIVAEVIGTTALKASDGFTKFWPSVIVVIGYGIAFYLLSLTLKTIPTGVQHGTVTVLMKQGQYEVTTLRGETTYSDGRRPDAVYFVDDIKDDLARRDFTINAIAYDVLEDRLIDPFDGAEDLATRTLTRNGEQVPITLVFEGPDRQRRTMEISAPVRPLNAPAGTGHGSMHKH